uniref:Uncharacterized protein n=1 Tax=Amphimedon queenslandica TaxID=400682 RepID=A0A1X7VUX3_AMPQE
MNNKLIYKTKQQKTYGLKNIIYIDHTKRQRTQINDMYICTHSKSEEL